MELLGILTAARSRRLGAGAQRDTIASRAREPGIAASHRLLLTRAAWIAALGLTVKFAALGKDVMLAKTFGAADQLDAFLVALAVPLFVWAVVAQTFSSAFIPVLIRVRQQEGEASADDLVRVMFGRVLIGLPLLTLVLAVGTRWFLPLLAGGFDRPQLALTEQLFAILLWIVPLSAISTYWGAILNASGVFALVALAPAATPLAVLAALIVGGQQVSVDWLAWGTVGGYAIELSVLAVGMCMQNLPVRPTWKTHRHARAVAGQYGYLFAGALLMSSSPVIDQSMATWLAPGSVSVLSYGYKLVAVLLGTLSVGVSTAVFPDFCRLAATGNRREIERTLKSLTRWLLLICVPLTLALLLLSRPIVGLLYQRGAMTAETASLVALVQACYLLQVPAYVIGILGARLLTALDGNRAMFCISAWSVGVNILGNLLLTRWLGVAGIALSTSCVYFCSAVLLHWSVKRRLGAPQPAVWAASVSSAA